MCSWFQLIGVNRQGKLLCDDDQIFNVICKRHPISSGERSRKKQALERRLEFSVEMSNQVGNDGENGSF